MAAVDLAAGEYLVWHGHTHAKRLVIPGLIFILVATLTGVGMAWLPDLLPTALKAWAAPVVAIIGAGLIIGLSLWPFLRWLTTTYSLTNHRVLTRRGLISRTSHGLPLARIHDVDLRQGLVDRLLGCGTIRLTTAAGQPLSLVDVPHVKRVYQLLNDELFTALESAPEESDVTRPIGPVE
jgi:uncharacterized membrane protein YdbT with pleckstrin-like domain